MARPTSRRIRVPERWPAWLFAVVLGANLLGCSDDPSDETKETDAGELADTAEDTGLSDATPSDSAVSDAVLDTAEPTDCPGNFWCPCKTNLDCDSSLCIKAHDGLRCTKTCIDSCPLGQVCLGNTGGTDQATYCVPKKGLLCRPCATDADCKSGSPAGARCVDYDGGGSFCGVPCATTQDCPGTTRCRLVKSTEGKSAKQCVRHNGKVFGTCDCDALSVNTNRATDCTIEETEPDKTGVEQVVRRCLGERICTDKGLTPCTKLKGAAAKCVDVQCEGKKDGDGCDDKDACTETDVCLGGKCKGTDTCPCRPGVKKCADDDDLCNGKPFCAKTKDGRYACKVNPGTVVTCSKANDTACKANVCAKKTGKCVLEPAPKTKACDDNLPCTVGDKCDGKGGCKAGTNTCKCQLDKDCDAEEDGNLCNGTLFCNKSKLPWTCTVNPKTVVKCAGDVPPCTVRACDSKLGKCADKPMKPGDTCDDGDACTDNDSCKALGKGPKLQCVGGKGICPCTTHADCVTKDDGNLCNGTFYCQKSTGNCRHNPATVVTCPTVDDTACLATSCVKKTGKCVAKPQPDGKVCFDGNPCTKSDTCKAGKCTAGTNTCQCTTDKDCVAKDDGDLCNGTLYCAVTGQGANTCQPNPATIVFCPSINDTACLRNRCQPKTGKCAPTPMPDNATCTDDNGCTLGDRCEKGACKGTSQVCQCQQDADCAKGGLDLCAGAFVCNKTKGTCELDPAKKVTCKADKDTACARNICAPLTGKCALQPVRTGLSCNDGAPCTTGDACNKGACVPGTNICTCASDKDCKVFDDGDICTGKYMCKAGTCVVHDIPTCDDKNPCTDDTCIPKGGCKNTNNDANTCVDKKGKTSACKAGNCVGDSPPVIDYDHDGVTGSADKCPTVWNPEGGTSACGTFLPAAGMQTRQLALFADSGKVGTKQWRSNEPVTVPLANGLKTDAIVHFRMDGSLKDDVTGIEMVGAVTKYDDKVPHKQLGKALLHPGNSLKVAKDASIAIGKAGITLMAWVRPTTKTGTQAIAAVGNGIAGKHIGLAVSGGQFQASDGKQTGKAGAVSIGAWRHVAVTVAGSQAVLYVDGVPGNGFKVALNDVGSMLTVGRFSSGVSAGQWTGAIDDVVLLNRAVGPDAIAAYVQSRATFGATFVPGSQADYDDIRVAERTRHQAFYHHTHFELAGPRPHSDTDLSGVVAYLPLDGSAIDRKNKQAAKTTNGAFGPGRFGSDNGGFLPRGKGGKGAIGWVHVDKANHQLKDQVTVEAWIRLDAASTGTQCIVSNQDGGGYGLCVGENGALQWGGSTGTAQVQVEASKLKLGRWYHVGGTLDGKELVAYVDGVEVGRKSFSGGFQHKNAAGLRIGATPNASSKLRHPFSGAIDDVVVHEVARSADYFANRARGLPRVTFLAHTDNVVSDSKRFLPFQYRLHWGEKKAAARPLKLTALNKTTTCTSLLSPCLSYAAWWRLDDAIAGRALDSAAGRISGVEATLPSLQPGYAGLARHYLAGSQRTTAVSQAALALGEKQHFTLELSARRAGTSLLAQTLIQGSQQGSLVFNWAGNIAGFSISGAGTKAANACTINNIHLGDGKWHRMAAISTGQGGTFRCRVDGASGEIKPIKHQAGGIGGKYTIGAQANGNQPFKGQVDDVRLMKRALTDDEMLHHPRLKTALTAYSAANCDDGNACTIDSLPEPGKCLNTKLTGTSCTTSGGPGTCKNGACASLGEDLDHDGVFGAADTCPWVWTPDPTAASICGLWPQTSGWKSVATVQLGEPGKAGKSSLRRTNEPVEVPLVDAQLGSLVPGAQLDLDDLRVTQTPPGGTEHRIPSELVGPRPHSDSVTTDVIGYWRFDGQSKAVVGPALKTKGLQYGEGAFGSIGRAGAFDGNAEASVSNNSALTGLFSDAVTVEAWFFWSGQWSGSGSAKQGLIVAHGNSTNDSIGVHLRPGDKGAANLHGTVVTASGKKDFIVAGAAPKEWHHIALTLGGGTARMWLDGVEVAAGKLAGKLKQEPGSQLNIGHRPFDKNVAFVGRIDDVVIHRKAKTAAYFANRARGQLRIRFLAHTAPTKGSNNTYALFTYKLRWGNASAGLLKPKLAALNKTTTCDALLSECLGYEGWWRMDDFHGDRLLDSSTHARHGTGTKVAQVSDSTGSSASFDGSQSVATLPAPLPKSAFTIEVSASVKEGVSNGWRYFATQGSVAVKQGWALALASKTGPIFDNEAVWQSHTPNTQILRISATKKNEWMRLSGGWTAKEGARAWFNNGQRAANSNWPVGHTGSSGILLGATTDPGGKSGHFSGRIRDVRLMNRRLTPDEQLKVVPLVADTAALKSQAVKTYNACNDSKPCTEDLVAPGGQCVNKPLDGGLCALDTGGTGTCVKGTCAATCGGFDLSWDVNTSAGGSGNLSDIATGTAEGKSGAIYTVGNTWSGASGSGFVTRLDAGKHVWTKRIGTSLNVRLAAAGYRPSGGVRTVGYGKGVAGFDVFVADLDGSGKLVASKTHHIYSSDRVLGGRGDSNGRLMAVGQSGNASAARAFIAVVGADGAVSMAKAHSIGAGGYWRAVVHDPKTGRYYVGGAVTDGGGTTTHCGVLDAKGKKVVFQQEKIGQVHSEFHDAAIIASSVVFVGKRASAGFGTVYANIVKRDLAAFGKRTLLHEGLTDKGKGIEPRRILALSTGDGLITGLRKDKSQPMVAVWSASQNRVLWSIEDNNAGSDAIFDAYPVLLASGHVVVAGSKIDGVDRNAWVRRLGVHGLPCCKTDAECAVPGYCQTLTCGGAKGCGPKDGKWTPACADGNSCTSDFCKPTSTGGTCTFSNKSGGSPCDDGNACTEKDICSGGKCQAGKAKLTTTTVTHGGKAVLLRDSFSLGDGTVFAAGNGGGVAVVARVPAGGSATTQATGGSTANAVAPLTSTQLITVGAEFHVAHFDHKLSRIRNKKLLVKGVANDVVGTANGESVAVGYDRPGNQSYIVALGIASNGNTKWIRDDKSALFSALTAVAKVGSNYAVAGQYMDKQKKKYVYVGMLSSGPNWLWQKKDAAIGTAAAAIAAVGTDVLVVGKHDLQNRGFISLWSSSGTRKWNSTMRPDGQSQGWFWDIERFDDRYLLAGSARGSTAGDKAWLVAIDQNGGVKWQQTYGTGSPSAGFASVGVVDAKTAAVVWGNVVQHVDAFGNSTCALSGSCSTKQAKDCEDGKACTYDQCSAGKCVHNVATSGTPCLGSKKCKGTVCQ